MMALSLSTRATLDFLGPEDLTRKLRMQTAVAPAVSALLVNSPLLEGRPCGLLPHRGWAWLRTDPLRTGLLPPALRADVSAGDLVDWALGIPLIHYRTADGRYHRAPGGTFADLLRGGLPDGTGPTAAHWSAHLSQLWTDTRVRRTLEPRGADGPPAPHLAALPALWTGLTYHPESCRAAWESTRHHTAEEHRAARTELPARGRTPASATPPSGPWPPSCSASPGPAWRPGSPPAWNPRTSPPTSTRSTRSPPPAGPPPTSA
ncbi:glutamate-cysteine ligase family protein [Kitasatospora cineracea]|uniref:glutamate-cysteine ligase family protein n=1 Tax=Kitasatospora cineracea TaxID=88074 RepID=UPI003F4D260C